MSNERARRELDEMFEAFIKPVRKESTEGIEWLRPLTGRQYWHPSVLTRAYPTIISHLISARGLLRDYKAPSVVPHLGYLNRLERSPWERRP